MAAQGGRLLQDLVDLSPCGSCEHKYQYNVSRNIAESLSLSEHLGECSVFWIV